MSECISVNKRVYFKEEIMIFDLDRYIDEPLVYFDDKKKIDDQKIFLLGVRIRSDMVDLLISGIKAKDIIVKALDPSEDPSIDPGAGGDTESDPANGGSEDSNNTPSGDTTSGGNNGTGGTDTGSKNSPSPNTGDAEHLAFWLLIFTLGTVLLVKKVRHR